MPYVKQKQRNELNDCIFDLADRIVTGTDAGASRAGLVNYTITKLLLEVYKDSSGYAFLNEQIGILECAKQEFYRRKAAPYEDTKIQENGDVY